MKSESMRSVAQLFVFILALVFVPISQSLPFIFIHGIADECSSSKSKQFVNHVTEWSGSQGYCVEVGNGFVDSWFMPLEDQGDIVCRKVKEMKELREGYNIVGFSQGNLIGRSVVEFCEGGPMVKNFISLGGPHAGIAALPLCTFEILCVLENLLVQYGAYTDYVQERLAPSNYLKIPSNMKGYLDYCKFLPKLNNEIPGKRNSTYKERFSSLENLILIMSEGDDVLVPRETSWFGYYPDGNFGTLLPPQQTKLYTEDWIGLKTLDEAGKVKFVSVKGEHTEISDEDIKKHMVPYLRS